MLQADTLPFTQIAQTLDKLYSGLENFVLRTDKEKKNQTAQKNSNFHLLN